LLVAEAELMERLRAEIDVPLTVIGSTVADESRRVRLLDAAGDEVALPAPGWEHLR
jgi:hypothetical protein